MSYTPGHWRPTLHHIVMSDVEPGKPTPGKCSIITDKTVIAHLTDATKDDVRLMAAAPKLLEACEAALRCISGLLAEAGATGRPLEVKQIRAAIAAAKGQE